MSEGDRMQQQVFGGGQAQPWNGVIFPSAGSNWPLTATVTASRLRAIPAIGRGLSLICGQIKQMPIEDYKGDRVQPRPRLLDQPDPDKARSWFVERQVEDYLVHGNAIALVTSRDKDQRPMSVVWVPAEWCSISENFTDGGTDYWVGGRELDRANVVHVMRGADSWEPRRGVGILEQYLSALQKLVDQEAYESSALNGHAVPSVVIVTPNPELTQTEADLAKSAWLAKFSGPAREPAVLPAGTEVKPLAWSPNDTQMAEAHKLGLGDAANMLNLDGYYLGAPSSSFTYQSPGPMGLALVRQTLNPIIADFEGVWSAAWMPRGHNVTFDRRAVQTDDLGTTLGWAVPAWSAGAITLPELRTLIGYGSEVPAELLARPAAGSTEG